MRFQLLYFVFSILLLIDFPLVVHNEDFSDSRRILNPKWNFPRPVIQDSPPQDTTESSSIGLEALSPYEIAKLLTDDPWSRDDIWNQLGIHSLHLGYEEIRTNRLRSPDQFLTSLNVDIKTYTDELDGEPGNEVLLRVSNTSEECRYVLFKPLKRRAGKPRWKLLGYIDHDFGRYQMPEHSIAHSGGRKWLMVTVQMGSGIGYAGYNNRLFSVDHTGLKEILQFPSEGLVAFCCDNYPIREFKTKLVRCEMSGATTTVTIDFLATWWAKTDGGKVGLWKKKQRARYQTDPISQKLTLDPSQSDFGEEEFKAMYDAAEDMSREDFICYNLAELSRIALEPENPRKNWLRHFLDQVAPSPEKEKLEDLLCR